MGCERYRQALSARLDGEPPPDHAPAGDLDHHLAGCPDCRSWQADAAAVTRLVRTGPAVAGPDVTEAVLPAAPGPGRSRLVAVLRVALTGFGVAQLVLGVLQVSLLRSSQHGNLHGSTVDGATPGHLWHESAAWNIAIGVAFLWVAARRGRPGGIVPILSVFIGILVVLGTSDLVAGRVEVARLASHGFVLIGYLLVLALSRPSLDLTPPGRQRERGQPAPGRVPDRDSVPPPIPLRRPDQPAAQYRRAA